LLFCDEQQELGAGEFSKNHHIAQPAWLPEIMRLLHGSPAK
jgi:hypothetical protein